LSRGCESSPPLPGSFGHHHLFETLEPLGQSVKEHFGGFVREITEELTVSRDHGSADMSDDFQQELTFLGMISSPSFVREPEGNGVA
jgi:putative transposase